LETMKSKLKHWGDSKRRGTIKSDILKDVGRKELAPQRRTTLSPPEEKKRMHLTWQDFDRMLWRLCFSELEELGKVVWAPKSKIKTYYLDLNIPPYPPLPPITPHYPSPLPRTQKKREISPHPHIL